MHRPSICWSLRRDLRDYVRTLPGDDIGIFVKGQWIELDRPTARLLAKRISQCLDESTRSAVRKARRERADGQAVHQEADPEAAGRGG